MVALSHVLILVVMEDGLVQNYVSNFSRKEWRVLILVVMEDGLVLPIMIFIQMIKKSLNPCCNGRWSRTKHQIDVWNSGATVLILVVMEDGLVLPTRQMSRELTDDES